MINPKFEIVSMELKGLVLSKFMRLTTTPNFANAREDLNNLALHLKGEGLFMFDEGRPRLNPAIYYLKRKFPPQSLPRIYLFVLTQVIDTFYFERSSRIPEGTTPEGWVTEMLRIADLIFENVQNQYRVTLKQIPGLTAKIIASDPDLEKYQLIISTALRIRARAGLFNPKRES